MSTRENFNASTLLGGSTNLLGGSTNSGCIANQDVIKSMIWRNTAQEIKTYIINTYGNRTFRLRTLDGVGTGDNKPSRINIWVQSGGNWSSIATGVGCG
jgi:hypothetical protein